MISAISLHANLDEWCAPLAPKRGSLTLRQTPVVECCVRSYHVLQLSAAMMSGLASTKGSAATRIAVPIMTILPARTHNRVMPLTDLQVYVTRGARYDARWMDATTTPTLPHAPIPGILLYTTGAGRQAGGREGGACWAAVGGGEGAGPRGSGGKPGIHSHMMAGGSDGGPAAAAASWTAVLGFSKWGPAHRQQLRPQMSNKCNSGL